MSTLPYTRDDTMASKPKDDFETVNTFALEGGSLAYQRNECGSHRICLVDKDGKEVAPSHPVPHEHPVFMVIGTQQFVAFSQYYDGGIEACVIFKLDALDLIRPSLPKVL